MIVIHPSSENLYVISASDIRKNNEQIRKDASRTEWTIITKPPVDTLVRVCGPSFHEHPWFECNAIFQHHPDGPGWFTVTGKRLSDDHLNPIYYTEIGNYPV